MFSPWLVFVLMEDQLLSLSCPSWPMEASWTISRKTERHWLSLMRRKTMMKMCQYHSEYMTFLRLLVNGHGRINPRTSYRVLPILVGGVGPNYHLAIFTTTQAVFTTTHKSKNIKMLQQMHFAFWLRASHWGSHHSDNSGQNPASHRNCEYYTIYTTFTLLCWIELHVCMGI